MDITILVTISILLILIIINAFFAAAEMAIVAVNKTRIEILAEEGNKNAKILLKLFSNPNDFLSTIQVGITLAGFLSSAFAASQLESSISSLFINLGVSQSIATGLAIILITLVLSYFSLVFGELVPKRIALQNSEKIALSSIKIIVWISKITAVFVKFLSASTNIFLKLLKVNTNDLEEKITEEEITKLLEVGEQTGLINKTGKKIMENVFLFDDKLAKEVMTTRKNIFLLDGNKSFKEQANEYFKYKYSRVPVYQDDIDNIIGIVYMKDLITKIYEDGVDNVDVLKLTKKAFITSEHRNIDVLFQELQSNKKHIAILVDEYGVVSGLVTIEDLIEELVGEIEDEFDQYDDIVKINNNTYLVKGFVSVSDLNEFLKINLELDNENFDSIAGLIIEKLGDIPTSLKNSEVVIDNITLKPVRLANNTIEEIRVEIK